MLTGSSIDFGFLRDVVAHRVGTMSIKGYVDSCEKSVLLLRLAHVSLDVGRGRLYKGREDCGIACAAAAVVFLVEPF